MSNMLVLVNPHSGPGKAEMHLRKNVLPKLRTEPDLNFKVVVTEQANHALNLIKSSDMSQIDSICVVGGDGLLFEVINGLLANSDAAISTPIAVYPGGSGNAIAACVAAKRGYKIEKSLSTFISASVQSLTSNSTERFNLIYVESGTYSSAGIIGVNWGFLSDCDIESEKYRRVLGGMRFHAQAVARLTNFRKYRGRISYLRAGSASTESCYSSSTSDFFKPHSIATRQTTDIIQKRLLSKLRTRLPPLNEPVPPNWETIEGKFVWISTSLVSHMARDLLSVPVSEAAKASDYFYLNIVRAGVSKAAMAQLLLKLGDPNCSSFYDPNVQVIPVTAFRIEPLGHRQGIFTVDGELIPSNGSLQGCLTTWGLNIRAPPQNESIVTRF